ncbi:MAG TPA: cation-transporting P-type ATPase, partial [Methylotenera sp.]|nr:cation-transporting P-type ATPase [Methylotenera sp.]
MTERSEKILWHSQHSQQCLQLMACTDKGLSEDAVIQRRQQYGFNQLPVAKPVSPLKRLLRQFNSVLIIVLMLAATVTALLD